MSKKLFALVAASMAAVPMLAKADTANTNVYGTLNFDTEWTGLSTRHPDARWRLSSNSSNFGVKGSEDLATGLKGVYQVELGLALTASGFSSQPFTFRNTMIGVSGESWGTVSYGIWDTPFKTVTIYMEPFYGTGVGYLHSLIDTVGGGAASPSVWSGAGGATGSANALTFDRRQGNNLQYWSPKFYGVTFKGMGSWNPDNVGFSLLSGSLAYEEGPVTAGVAYEAHYDFNKSATATTSRDTGLKATAGYRIMEGTQIAGEFSSLAYKGIANDQTIINRSRPAFGVSILHKMEEITFRLGGALATKGSCELTGGAACAASVTDNTGSKMLTAGASYSFSKRTDAYLVFSKIYNESAANYDFAINGLGGVTAGAQPTALGLGFRHTF